MGRTVVGVRGSRLSFLPRAVRDNRRVTLKIVIDEGTEGRAAAAPYEQVRAQIAAQARSGSLPVGYKLPTVRGLAEGLGLAIGLVLASVLALFGVLFSQMVLALGKAVPLPAREFRKSLRRWILFEKIQHDVGFQIGKYPQRPHRVFLKRYRELIELSGLFARQPMVVASKQPKFLGLYGVRLKRAQMTMIGPQKLCQYVGVKRIVLRLTHAKAVSGSIQCLGVNRIDHHSMVQKKLNDPSLRLLDGRPHLPARRPAFVDATIRARDARRSA